MSGYSPLRITGMQTGLVQERENFLLPDDAYPTLQNAYVWRERILRKQGYSLLGRLQREYPPTGTFTITLTAGEADLITLLDLESTASIVPGSISVVGSVDGTTYTDTLFNGTLTAKGGSGSGGTINYATGEITIVGGGAETLTGTLEYYPGLPVMGIRRRELINSANDQTIFFDQTYAYIFNNSMNAFQEWIPGTTWNANGNPISSTDFFWSTNWWTSAANVKLFWVTNNSGAEANPDPIRFTDGVTWTNFTPPTYGQIDATPTYLVQCLALLPYRGRLLAFNTFEGPALMGATNFRQRIRWSTIGNPFIPFAEGPPATGSWRDDIRGQGGFLDIPTTEDIVSVGYVRDNLVIYCERSTWQLRYTGRSIAPFQIEKVNSELGAEGPFSTIQFDTSLLAIGDRGILECDSYKAERIDIKIPDFVFYFQGASTTNNSPFRVHGIRDFPNRLAYWTIPLEAQYDPKLSGGNIFPNIRLVYNYENDSWALFNDSLTTLGNYQAQSGRTWLNTHIAWINCHFPWIDQAQAYEYIVGGNQQGFVEYLDTQTTNDVSLYISALTQSATVTVTSPNHNMNTDFVIGISGIPAGTAFSSLNGGIYGIIVLDQNTFNIYTYDLDDDAFNVNVIATPSGTYVGSGLIKIRENFSIKSKKFNFLDEGQNIQLGYLDILLAASANANPGAISLYVYLNYDDVNASNTLTENTASGLVPDQPDTFFNSTIPTTPSTYAVAAQGTKFWQRVYCATRANFLTLQYKFSNAQMAGIEQHCEVQIDAQVLWIRRGGRLTQF